MFIARFSYDVLPVNRQQAMDFIRQEVEATQTSGLRAGLLVPLTRGQGGAGLKFEVELTSLDQLEELRHRGAQGSRAEGEDWMRAFSEILLAPPLVEILRTDDRPPG